MASDGNGDVLNEGTPDGQFGKYLLSTLTTTPKAFRVILREFKTDAGAAPWRVSRGKSDINRVLHKLSKTQPPRTVKTSTAANGANPHWSLATVATTGDDMDVTTAASKSLYADLGLAVSTDDDGDDTDAPAKAKEQKKKDSSATCCMDMDEDEAW